MSTVRDVINDANRRRFASQPEADALYDRGALDEAYILAVELDAILLRVTLLLDCRGALQIQLGNTAVVIIHGVRSFRWTKNSPVGDRTQHTITGWEPSRPDHDSWELLAHTIPAGSLSIVGTSAEFFVGNVPGCDMAPPDFIDASDDEVRAGLAGWNSEFTPLHATFFGR